MKPSVGVIPLSQPKSGTLVRAFPGPERVFRVGDREGTVSLPSLKSNIQDDAFFATNMTTIPIKSRNATKAMRNEKGL